jgi:hypothetical protein
MYRLFGRVHAALTTPPRLVLGPTCAGSVNTEKTSNVTIGDSRQHRCELSYLAAFDRCAFATLDT